MFGPRNIEPGEGTDDRQLDSHDYSRGLEERGRGDADINYQYESQDEDYEGDTGGNEYEDED